MNCPTLDELSCYVDGVLSGTESERIRLHLSRCASCQEVVDAFAAEEAFLSETFTTPGLPADFTDTVMNRLGPSTGKNKRKTKLGRRLLISAAGVVLAVGFAALNPSFAELIGGIFSSERVDEGLQNATAEGMVDRVDLSVTDAGLTFKVEDVLADASRVTLSYLLINKHGKQLDSFIDFPDAPHEVTVTDQNGRSLETFSGRWFEDSDYGYLEFSLREYDDIEKVTVSFDIKEINGVNGNWQLDIPIDLTEKRMLTETVLLDKTPLAYHGVMVQLKKWQMTPSSSELYYETKLSETEQKRMKAFTEQVTKELTFEDESLSLLWDTKIAYHVTDENSNVVYESSAEVDAKGFLQSTGQKLNSSDHIARIDSFIPQKVRSPLTVVMEGIYKVEPVDVAISFDPKQIKAKPISFDYAGNFLTIEKAELHTEYGLRKSWNPISKQTSLKIELTGDSDAGAAEPRQWIVTDDAGVSYPAFASGGTAHEPNAEGRYEKSVELEVYGIKSISSPLTLRLLTAKQFYAIEEEIKVPLY